MEQEAQVTHAPHPSIIFIEVPVAGVDWAKKVKPALYRKHKAKREAWPPVQPIPHLDRAEILRRVEEARRAIAEARPQIEAMLA
jgi:hypothetical protein